MITLPPLEAGPGAGLRGAEALAAERGGLRPWCGPAAVALAANCSYARACALLREVAPTRYTPGEEIVTVFWRDLLEAVERGGVGAARLAIPGRPTLLRLVRQGGLEAGLYLVRVTGHFLLLRHHGFGLAQVDDNRLSNALLTAHTHGRCRVTHLARLTPPAPPAEAIPAVAEGGEAFPCIGSPAGL